MKTSTLPSLRVTPEFRQEAESVLLEGESLSGFVEEAVRHSVYRRKAQQEFIERGLAAGCSAREQDAYVSRDEAMDSLREILARCGNQA